MTGYGPEADVAALGHVVEAFTAFEVDQPAQGLPVGVQLIGPMFEDRTPPRLAELPEQRIAGFRAPQQGVAPAGRGQGADGDASRR
ncbi:hypothetical protein [Streptomyces sp. NPDC056160]|uniref:hypothetical protein n=1 Tax=Streptomyces sp. NPDC056160 TaxID=3345731 RepID=UPI0035DE915E